MDECHVTMSERLFGVLRYRMEGRVTGFARMRALVAYRDSHDVKDLGCWRMETYAQAPDNRTVVKHLA